MVNLRVVRGYLLRRCFLVGVLFIAQPTRAQLAPDCNGFDFYGRPTSAIQVPGCPDPIGSNEYNGRYIGHDEASVLFYSDKPHSASDLQWEFVLPREHAPPATQSFQNFTSFWFGLPICDPNSFPFGPCTPASDSNDPALAGAGDLEFQFYPPGKDRNIDVFSCSIDQWCAAVNIFSSTGQFNFALIQIDGVPAEYPGPSNPFRPPTPNAKTLLLGQGDRIRVTLKDTPDGLLSVVEDLTTGASGFIVASAANGFETVNSSGQKIPFDFRPLYDTATPDHIVSFFVPRIGVMFTMELGHNEQADNDSDERDQFGNLLCSRGPVVPACYLPNAFPQPGDRDYDGTSYIRDWPGSPNRTTATSIKIQSAEGGGIGPLSASDNGRDYDGVYDRIQFQTAANVGNPECLAQPATCNVHVPFDGMAFYPFFALNEHDSGHFKPVVTVGAGAKNEKQEVCSLLFGDFANNRETNNFGGDAQYGFPDDPRDHVDLVSDLQPNPCVPIIHERHAKD